MSVRRGFTYVELLVCIMLAVVVVALTLPYLAKTRTYHGGARCSNNLRQIGLAIELYRLESKGQYPRTLSDDALPLKLDSGGQVDANPFAEPGLSNVGANNVPASLFLLIRTTGISTEVFTCPSSVSSKDTMGGLAADQRSNFTDVTVNLAYGYATPFNLGVSGYQLPEKSDKEFAIAADLGPGRSAATVTRADAPTAQQQQANSRNHSREGQNVLYADAHATWERTVFVGVGGNNIYLGDGPSASDNKSRVYANTSDARSQKPTSAHDSVVVPWETDN